MLTGALLAVLAGCAAPKRVTFFSPFKDFSCDVPWGWAVYLDAAGSDYTSVTFAGPLEPEFLRGTPSLTVRWYAYGAAHKLPDGNIERYVSAGDFKSQMLREVYGPECPPAAGTVEACAYTRAGSDFVQALAASKGMRVPDASNVKVAGVTASYYVVYRNRPVPRKALLGIVEDAQGGAVVRQRHAYVVLPLRHGFYVLVYPATRDGFEKYKDDFWRMVNSFQLLKEGPAGPVLAVAR